MSPRLLPLQSEEVIVIGEGEVPTSTEAKDAMDDCEVRLQVSESCIASLSVMYCKSQRHLLQVSASFLLHFSHCTIRLVNR